MTQNLSRFGMVIQGSYCGTEKPIIRLMKSSATEKNEQKNASEPTPVLLLMRESDAGIEPDDSEAGRDWNQVVRNLRIELNDDSYLPNERNTGAVGIRHQGAEGSSIQDVAIDATNGFAGLYYIHSSGGYTYDVEIIGGDYGIYAPEARGGSPLIVGLKMSSQEKTPIAVRHFGPINIVGFDIETTTGKIFSTIEGNETFQTFTVPGYLKRVGMTMNGTFDSSGHLSLVDGTIEVTGTASTILENRGRSVYLKNVYVKGSDSIVINYPTESSTSVDHSLITETDSSNPWYRVTEYSYSGIIDRGSKLIEGLLTDDTYYDGGRFPSNQNITVSEKSTTKPSDLISRHTYDAESLCNVEGVDVVFVTANLNDTDPDTTNIQDAIDVAKPSGNYRVFLPAGDYDLNTDVISPYIINDTLKLKKDTKLCGVSGYASVLEVTDSWGPSENISVITTVDDSSATSAIADFGIITPKVGGNYPTYDAYIYSIHWTAGRNSIFRDVFDRYKSGEPGERKMVQITGNGGGRWYGLTQHGGHPFGMSDPILADSPPPSGSGALLYSPNSRHLEINNTTGEPLIFYPFHCQHLTPPNDLSNEIMGSQCDIINSSNVTLYGIKNETASSTEKSDEMISHNNNTGHIPSWMMIKNSSNISLIGYEGLAQHEEDGALINIINSTDITIANMGRRFNYPNAENTAIDEDQWFFLKEEAAGSVNEVKARGFLSLFKSEECYYYILDDEPLCI